MTTLRTLRKLLFGETWLVPLGVAAALALTGAALHGGAAPARIGGFVLLAGVLAVLLLSVARSARPKMRGPGDARSDPGAAASTATLPGGVPDA